MPEPAKPRLKTPPGACDTHLHIYGPPDRYPVRSPGAFPPRPGSEVADYRAVQARLGLERLVIVQPAAYGDDNSCTLDALAAFGERARGVAVVEPDVADAELARLTQAGIRGLRFFMLPGGALGWEALEPMATRVAEHGWHVQLQLDGRDLPQHLARLKRLPATLVIDHVGKYLEPVPPDHPAFAALLDLVDTGRVWVKLSAAYEVSKSGPPGYEDVGRLARILAARAPERMVWASNWPHPSVPAEAAPDDAVLLDTLLHWVDDEATRRRILVDNPAQLYGFAPP